MQKISTIISVSIFLLLNSILFAGNRQEPTKQEQAKQESTKQESAKQESTKQEPTKQRTAKQEPELKAKLLKENNCLICHQNPTGKPEVDKAFLLWDKSSHSSFGVTCNSCHKGDVSQKEKEKAHIGFLEMEKPKSNVYYMKMDTNCGVCHESEYKDFESSNHYRFLQKGSGPSCISCHDPKSGQVLNPNEIIASCYTCHNKDLKGYENVPDLASNIIELTNVADTLVNWAEQFIEIAKKEGKKTNLATAKLFNAKREVVRAKYWHTFDLAANKEHALNAIKAAKEAKESLN